MGNIRDGCSARFENKSFLWQFLRYSTLSATITFQATTIRVCFPNFCAFVFFCYKCAHTKKKFKQITTNTNTLINSSIQKVDKQTLRGTTPKEQMIQKQNFISFWFDMLWVKNRCVAMMTPTTCATITTHRRGTRVLFHFSPHKQHTIWSIPLRLRSRFVNPTCEHITFWTFPFPLLFVWGKVGW
jgi:hypothetical protein